MNRKKKSKTKGSALGLILIALVVILIMGIGTLELGLRSRLFAIRTASGIAARCASDAGLTKCLYEMNQKLKVKPWNGSSLPIAVHEQLANSDTTFSYTVTPDTNDRYTVNSFGQSGPVLKRTYADLGLKGIFDNAILVRGVLSLMPNTLVTGYNSSDLTDTNFDVKIGTISTAASQVTLGPGSVVEGDAFCGVDGTPSSTISAGGTIQGYKYALSEEPPMPIIPAPPLPNMGTSLNVVSDLTIGPASNGTYTGLSVTGSKKLMVDGGNVILNITGDILLGNNAEVVLKANSTLTIYTSGTIIMDNSSGFNNENTFCGTLKVFATDTVNRTHTLRAKSSIFGVVYAPYANIDLYPNAAIYGSFVAANLTLKSGATFYYDEALRNVTVNDVGVYFVIKRWSED